MEIETMTKISIRSFSYKRAEPTGCLLRNPSPRCTIHAVKLFKSIGPWLGVSFLAGIAFLFLAIANSARKTIRGMQSDYSKRPYE